MGARILIIEDNPIVARTLARCVQSIRECAIAGSALEAQEFLRHDDAWCGFIVDARLSHDDGLRVLAEIRAKYPEAPCVVVTAYYDEHSIVNRARRLDAGLVAKPFSRDDLTGFLLDVVKYDIRLHENVASGVRRIAALRGLSAKEGAVLAHKMRGGPDKDILSDLRIGRNSLKTLERRIRTKLGVATLEGARRLVLVESEKRKRSSD